MTEAQTAKLLSLLGRIATAVEWFQVQYENCEPAMMVEITQPESEHPFRVHAQANVGDDGITSKEKTNGR